MASGTASCGLSSIASDAHELRSCFLLMICTALQTVNEEVGQAEPVASTGVVPHNILLDTARYTGPSGTSGT
jgi:hypothetical protein